MFTIRVLSLFRKSKYIVKVKHYVDKPHPEFGNLNFGKNIWEEIKINQKWSLRKMSYMYMHCLFKFLERQPAY